MRWTCAVLLALGTASAASGQIAWVGASWGASWEGNPASAPDTSFLHSSDGAPALFVAMRLDEDVFLRLKAAELPHIQMIDGVEWPGKYDAYTAGIDYVWRSPFGFSTMSVGLGSYQLNLKAKNPPPGSNESKLGWYFGLGEWFTITRKWKVTAELAMNRTQHAGKPTIYTANVGLAYGF